MQPSPVVLDVGSAVVKAGRAGENAPSAVFPSLVGRPKFARALMGGALEAER
jgi:actin-related protein